MLRHTEVPGTPLSASKPLSSANIRKLFGIEGNHRQLSIQSVSNAKSQQSVFLIYYWLLNFHNRIFFAYIYVAIGLYDDTVWQYLRDDARLLPARSPPHTQQNPHTFF